MNENSTFQFVLGWIFLITILTLINKTRLGHVIIYYSLLLMILFILLVEYKQLAPILGSVETIGQFNAQQALTTPTQTNTKGNL